MVSLARGYSFTDGVTNDCSATNLHALMTSALVSGITYTEFATNSFPNYISTIAPTVAEGRWWYDATNDLWRESIEGVFQDRLTRVQMVNSSSTTTIHKGSPLVMAGSFSVSRVATDAWPEIVGVAEDYINPSGSGFVRKFGFAEVLCWGPFTPGDLLVSGVISFDGYAKSSTFLEPSGNFEMNIAFGQCFASFGSGFSGLATMFLFT